jgi:AAA+ superfamily predicted ATPase
MVYTHRIVFLLLCVINSLLPINSGTSKPIKLTPFYEPEIPKDAPNQKREIFSEEDIEEMELVFESSPEKAQDIVKYLQDPTYFPSGVDFRFAFFVGEPGSGKTITANAIAYKMAQEGWDYKIIPSTSFLGVYRNQTAIQLRKELEIVAASNKPTILIIDELHRLLENANSKHHDTDATSTALWTFLDKQKNNKNFFFIGTMNRANKLPKPLKDRIFSGYIPFPLMADSLFKNKLLRKKLTSSDSYLDTEVNDVFLDKELEKLGPCSGRNLKLISQNILMMHKGNKEKPVLIKKESIVRAIDEHIRDKAAMEYDLEDETDEERQERHHKENMTLQEKHHAEQMRLQKDNQEIEELHFLQQQFIQVELANYQDRLNYDDIDHDSSGEFLKYNFSEKQKQLYKAMMKDTLAKKAAAIAAEKQAEKEKMAQKK